MAMRVFRAIYNFSVKYYIDEKNQSMLEEYNPVRTLNNKNAWHNLGRRKTDINVEQLPDWIHAVFSYQDRGQKLQTNRDFLITLMLTGLRRAECESLLWSSIDLNYGFIISIDSNNGERHALPMGDYLFNLMKKRRANVTGEWVFPSAKSASGHMVNISKVRQKMNDACGVQFTLHDLRRIFGLIAESLDYGRYTIQHLLNKRHDDRDITAEHIQVSDQKLREAMNAIEDIVLGEYKFKHVCQ